MRSIIHLDLDAFFCSVEILKDPGLKGKPVVVGGKPEQRGVVAAASYPARKYGIHSAMPMFKAQKLCENLIIVPPHFKLYQTYSKIVMGIMQDVSPDFEQISVDEAFLDLSSQVKQWDEAVKKAKKLQLRISRDVGLSASIGIATNKMVAKVASDIDKPSGFIVVNPGDEKSFLAPLAIDKISGIGPKTVEKLAELKVRRVSDLAGIPEEQLIKTFGKVGIKMAKWSRGKDDSPVGADRTRKSISHERTFAQDISWEHELLAVIEKLSLKNAEGLKQKQLVTNTVTIKIRYSDFSTFTRQQAIRQPTDSEVEINNIAQKLFLDNWETNRPVRLLGVGVSIYYGSEGQLSLALN